MNTSGLKDARSILVVRLGAIGDALRVCPAVRRIRRDRPDARIGWAVEHWAYPVVAGSSNVDRFHVLDRRELRAGWSRGLKEFVRLVREIRSERYEVVLDFHGRFKSGLVTRCSGARWRVGYAPGQVTERSHLFSNVHVRLDDPLVNRVQRFLQLLEPLGIDTAFDPSDTGIEVAESETAKAGAWYESAGRPVLAAFPGCSANQSAYHRWPKENWIELLNRLSCDGVQSIVFWGPDEEKLTREIAEGAGEPCRMAPETGLVEMMAMLGQFPAFVGSNTAAMHMAWLQGVPTALFTGPAQPRTDAPLPHVASRVLRASEHVQAGTSKRLQADVVGQVSVDEAYEAVTSLLEESCKQEGKRRSVS